MTRRSSTEQGALGVFAFITAFAAPAIARPAEELIDCLAPVTDQLFVVCDQRADLSRQPGHVSRAAKVPTLRYLASKRPTWWSALLWILKLFWVMTVTSWALVRNRRRMDVVICFLASFYTPVLVCGRLLGKKVISYEPGTDVVIVDSVYGRDMGGRLLKRLIGLTRDVNRLLAHRCVVESLHAIEQNELRRHAWKVRRAHLYVSRDFYRVTMPFERGPAVVGYVGRLMGGKGTEQLLDAALALLATGVRSQLVDSGPLLGYVTSVLERPEKSHVDLRVSTDAQGIVEYLNTFRLMVLPSRAEGLPNALLEAMACGTPVLATAVGGIPDLITHGVTGFTLPQADARTIAEGIRDCLARQDLGAVAERGRMHVARNYSLGTSAEGWRAVFDELVPSTAGRADGRVVGL